MKSLNISELDNLAEYLNEFRGARLQKLVASKRELGLGFYYQGQEFYLWVDLLANAPMALVLEAVPSFKSSKPPILLFLKAHALGKKLNSVTRINLEGRVLAIDLAGEEHCRLEIRRILA